MKQYNVKLLMAAVFITLVSCRFKNRSDTVRDFIPGVYVRMFEDSTGSGRIVLSISEVQEGHYFITRKSSVVNNRHGKEQSAREDSTMWRAIYDPRHRLLHEQRKGKVLLFVPEENRLLIGGTAYLKIKP